MRTFIVRHLIIILAVICFAAGAGITVEVLGFTGHLTGHDSASCTYQGYPVQAGQLLDPHGQMLACLEGQMVRVTFPAPESHTTAFLRPTWDGQHPARWTGTDAMCPASSARLHRWARTAPGAPWFRVECLPDGPHQWAWDAIVKKG